VTEAADRRRFAFWAYFSGGDRSRPIGVGYEIPEHGGGFYRRYEGDAPVGLLRYDGSQSWPSGARLGRDGQWLVDERPYRNRMLGSDHGDPVTHDEAGDILEQLGHSRDLLYEPVSPDETRDS
jgi:hypothetical protein